MYTATETTTGPAIVVRNEPGSRAVWIQRDKHDLALVEARLALAQPVLLAKGDVVLVTGSEDGEWYVIGVLERTGTKSDQRVELSDGVVVESQGVPGQEVLRVVSEAGELLFEYDVSARRTSVHLRPGDVEFIAQEGAIGFAADQGIRLRTAGVVQVEGQRGVAIASEHASLKLSSHATELAGPHIGVRTPSLKVQAVDSEFTGRKLLARFRAARVVAETLESVLGNLVQKAKNVFRRTSGIDELHTKHSRTLVDQSQHLTAGTIHVKAAGDVRIDGEQIHLG